MIITIITDIGMQVTLHIDVNEMMYCGNGPSPGGKFIWMGEKEHHKSVEICLSKAELSTLERTYNLSELEVTQEVKE